MSKGHIKTRLKFNSPQVGQTSPGSRSILQEGDDVIICEEKGVAFTLEVWQEYSPDWGDGCPYCNPDLTPNLSFQTDFDTKPLTPRRGSMRIPPWATFGGIGFLTCGFIVGLLLLFREFNFPDSKNQPIGQGTIISNSEGVMNDTGITPTNTSTVSFIETPINIPQPTWTPTDTPLPAATWTPTNTPLTQPTWTPTNTPAPPPTWTATTTPPPSTATWTPTYTPVPPPTWTPTHTPPPPTEENLFPDLDWVVIPAGSFIMGSSDADIEGAMVDCNTFEHNCQGDWFRAEGPQRTEAIDKFEITRYEITNAQYNLCVETGSCSPPRKISSDNSVINDSSFFIDNYPVVTIRVSDANTFCHWVGGRLPSQQEWEKAARGTDGRRYPWGNVLDITRANLYSGSPSPVGSYLSGASPFGILDMAGNAAEFTSNNVVRGGSWKNYPHQGRTTNRSTGPWLTPDFTNFDIGFRCAR